MTDLNLIRNFLENQFPAVPCTVERVQNLLCINGRIPFPIVASKSYDRSGYIIIQNENTDPIAEIIFTKADTVEIVSLPVEKFTCFASEYPNDIITDNHYTFNHDYVLLLKDNLVEYLNKYKTTSPVWGSFFHLDDLPNNVFSKVKSTPIVTAIENILIDRQFYKDSLEIAINETNPFNRFLKLYHLLEVNFDIHTAEKLREFLNLGNMELEISRTLKDYNREDSERLKSLLIAELIPGKIVPFLNEISNYRATAEQLFYVYGKDSNPLKQMNQFDAILAKGGFNEDNVNAVIGNNRFIDIIPKITAYWIYRIRSSIAHNRLGEYLMTQRDEEFIVEFAEPLIKESIIHVYKN